jgi:hypothetical protein
MSPGRLIDLRTLVVVYASRDICRSRESWEMVYSRRTSKGRAVGHLLRERVEFLVSGCVLASHLLRERVDGTAPLASR